MNKKAPKAPKKEEKSIINYKKYYDNTSIDKTRVPENSIKELKEALKKSIIDINLKNWFNYIPAKYSAYTGFEISKIEELYKKDKEIKHLWDLMAKKFKYYEAVAILKENYKDRTFSSELEDYDFGVNPVANSENFEEEEIDFNDFKTKGDFNNELEEFQKQ